MEFLHTFFALNHQLIYFGYGLVFFILGLAIALQSRHSSRLDLARSLNWLAAFGFSHAFNEWGDLFIPIQSNYLSPETIKVLQAIHLLLLAVSFTFLFEFGVTLLKPLGRTRWLHGVSGALLAIWIFVTYFPLASLIPNFNTWYSTAAALARYFIGFPGGLLAAYGLRQNTFQRIQPLEVPHIIKMLRFAGIMMALYAVFGGLIPSPVPFFPGNILNSVNLEHWIGIPPEVFRSIFGLVMAISVIRGLEVFDLETERKLEAMEQQQILANERNRIARELHDGAIQKVYTAGLLVESASKLIEDENSVLTNRLEKAEAVLNDAISDLRQNLKELSTNPEGEPLPVMLRRLVEDPRFQSLVDIQLDMDLPEEPLSPIRVDHILAVINEALSNAVRHSNARHIKITARSDEELISISVQDDGIGFPKEFKAGYGLRNMRDRARILGGHVKVDNVKGKGTRIELTIPWKDER